LLNSTSLINSTNSLNHFNVIIDHEKDQVSSQIISRSSLILLEEKTCDLKKNVFKNDNSEQDFNTSFEEDFENFSIRNLIHLIHEFYKAQNSINSHSLQNEKLHEHQALSHSDSHIQLSSFFFKKLSEYQMFMTQCNINFILCSNTYKRNEQKVLFVLTLLHDITLF
jgi:hypothetical protein